MKRERDIYDLPPAAFGKRIGLDVKGQHIATEELLDLAVAAYERNSPTKAAALRIKPSKDAA